MPFTHAQIPNLLTGRRYKVIYLIPGQHRYARFSVMDFISHTKDAYRDYLSFSARPEAGTQDLDVRWVHEITLVPQDTAIQLNRRA